MNSDKQKLRSEIPSSDKWNIEAMYPDEKGFSEDIAAGIAGGEILASMKGHLMDSPSSLLKALLTYSDSMRKIERAYIYAHMKRDEDNSDSKYSELFGKAAGALTDIDDTHNEQHEHCNQRNRADEAEFFADDRIDEVGIADRQELQTLLRPVEEAFAEQTARANRDLGLVDLIVAFQR
jgi:oligoendopeptidase F